MWPLRGIPLQSFYLSRCFICFTGHQGGSHSSAIHWKQIWKFISDELAECRVICSFSPTLPYHCRSCSHSSPRWRAHWSTTHSSNDPFVLQAIFLYKPDRKDLLGHLFAPHRKHALPVTTELCPSPYLGSLKLHRDHIYWWLFPIWPWSTWCFSWLLLRCPAFNVVMWTDGYILCPWVRLQKRKCSCGLQKMLTLLFSVLYSAGLISSNPSAESLALVPIPNGVTPTLPLLIVTFPWQTLNRPFPRFRRFFNQSLSAVFEPFPTPYPLA